MRASAMQWSRNNDTSQNASATRVFAIRAFRGEDGGATSSLRRVVADIRRTHFSLTFR
jgi:hypothetical protein